MNSRSSALNSVPEIPVMKARVLMGPISPQLTHGSRKRRLIPWDETLPADGNQAFAELRRLFRGIERTDHRAIDRAFFAAEIGTFDDRRTRAQNRREFALQHTVGRLCVALALLRGDRNQI